MDCIWVNLKKNVGLPFLKFMVPICQCICYGLNLLLVQIFFEPV